MKKLSFLLLALLAVTMFTACNKSDDPVNKQTISATVNNRAVDGGEVVFSQGNAKVELNYTDMIIKISAEYKDANNIAHSLTTPDMKMSSVSSSVRYFNNSDSQTANLGFDGLEGYIDFATGMMWYSFVVDSSTRIVSTTPLLYAYATTETVNPENGNHGEHQRSAYTFLLNSKGETCNMIINNLIPNLNGTIEAQEIQYNGLTLTPTTDGYTITADQAESSYKGFYTITDVNFVISSQCRTINGSFKCNGLEFRVNGPLFNNN